MKVYVVMGNDFPDSVFKEEKDAETYCDEKRKANKPGQRVIYWRVYDFEVK